MQDAIPYKRPCSTNQNNSSGGTSSTTYLKGSEGHDLKSIVEETPVVLFMKKGDCMGHVVKRLLQGLGVNPAVYGIDEKDENHVSNELTGINEGGGGEGGMQFPVVFIGGEFFGGLDRVMATHITGELTLALKQAGALWL